MKINLLKKIIIILYLISIVIFGIFFVPYYYGKGDFVFVNYFSVNEDFEFSRFFISIFIVTIFYTILFLTVHFFSEKLKSILILIIDKTFDILTPKSEYDRTPLILILVLFIIVFPLLCGVIKNK